MTNCFIILLPVQRRWLAHTVLQGGSVWNDFRIFLYDVPHPKLHACFDLIEQHNSQRVSARFTNFHLESLSIIFLIDSFNSCCFVFCSFREKSKWVGFSWHEPAFFFWNTYFSIIYGPIMLKIDLCCPHEFIQQLYPVQMVSLVEWSNLNLWRDILSHCDRSGVWRGMKLISGLEIIDIDKLIDSFNSCCFILRGLWVVVLSFCSFCNVCCDFFYLFK